MKSHLRVIDAQGELQPYPDECPSCVQYERQMRARNRRITELEGDKQQEAEEHKLYPEAQTAFEWWQLACGHERCSFGFECFYPVVPRLKERGIVGVLQVIAGLAYDPYESEMKKGKMKRHDGWHLICESGPKCEERAERAPGEGEEWKLWLVQRIESRLRCE